MPQFDKPLDELQRYDPPETPPADFDSFWHDTLAAQPTAGPAMFTRVDQDVLKLVDAHDVTFAGYAGQAVRAWFIEPAGNQDRLPCLVRYIGYGGGRGMPVDHLAPTACGFAQLVMDTRGQGGVWSRGETPDEHGAGSQHPGFMTRGIESRETYYFRRVIIDAVRAVETAAAHPHVDPQRVAVIGGSQGGGLAIAAAALAPERVRLLLADVPFLCHFRRATTLIDSMPYAEIGRYLKVHRDRVEQVFETLAYFDGVHFAPRIRARCLFSTALMDETCPPSTVYAAYNRITAEKQIVVYPFNAHEGGGGDHLVQQLRFARAHL